jgi:hypothetical protein
VKLPGRKKKERKKRNGESLHKERERERECIQAGRLVISAVTSHGTPRLERIPLINPQGNVKYLEAKSLVLVPDETRFNQRNFVSCSTYTPWRESQEEKKKKKK